MSTIYIGNDFKCHLTNDGTMTPVETDAFDGKCQKYIEGFRFVPAGETWTREDGVAFQGQMISPHTDYAILAAYQEQYEENSAELKQLKDQNADMQNALTILEVKPDE